MIVFSPSPSFSFSYCCGRPWPRPGVHRLVSVFLAGYPVEVLIMTLQNTVENVNYLAIVLFILVGNVATHETERADLRIRARTWWAHSGRSC
jgi:hypothetical protein